MNLKVNSIEQNGYGKKTQANSTIEIIHHFFGNLILILKLEKQISRNITYYSIWCAYHIPQGIKLNTCTTGVCLWHDIEWYAYINMVLYWEIIVFDR